MANFIDRAISFLSPKTGAARAKARLVERNLSRISERGYEGGKRGRRFNGWKIKGGQSANDVIAGDISLLRDRSRDLVRNNPYAARAVTVITSNTVGTGIVPTVISKNEAEIERRWLQWGETEYCDFDGRLDFYGLQNLWMNTVVQAGEVFIRKVLVKPEIPGRDLNVKLQTLEPEFLDRSKSYQNSDRFCVSGIEFSNRGERLGYWIYPSRPSSSIGGRDTAPSVLIPASEIHHMYRVDRPGQIFGVPWLSPVILKLRDYDDYEDAQLLTKKMAACFGVFLAKDDDGDSVGDGASDDDAPEHPLDLEPGGIFEGKPGYQPVMINPPAVSDISEFSRISLQAVATGVGITYESLTQDLGRVNFSSGRMGWLEMNRNLKAWRHTVARPCNRTTYQWFLNACADAGVETRDAVSTWTEPRREAIDVTKEVEAEKAAVRMGKKSLTEVILENGGDPARTFQEIADERAKFKEMGLLFDSDAGLVPGKPEFGQQTEKTEGKDKDEDSKN